MNRIAWLTTTLLIMWPASSFAQLFTVSGTARDPAASPVANVVLQLFDGSGNPIGIPPTITNASGFYSISGLPAGTYGFGFGPPAAAHLVPRLLEGVGVSANLTLNVALDSGNLLSGFVRNSAGSGIPGIDLDVIDRSTGNELYTPSDNTDVTGFYDVVIPDGEYDLLWRKLDPPPAYIEVSRRETIAVDTAIDVTMTVGVFVSGTISWNALPLANANLDFIDASGVKLDTPGDVTDGLGFYRVHVPPGTYDIRIKVDPGTGIVSREFLDVPVAADTDFDAVVQSGVKLSGSVKNGAGVGVFDADIDVSDSATSAPVFLPFDKTDSGGSYVIAVPVGTWNIAYQPPIATLLAPVGLGNVVLAADTGIDVVVPAGVLVSGSVKNSQGVGVAGVDIDARLHATLTDIPIANDATDGAGNYMFVVAPGTYDFDFEPAKSLKLVARRIANVVIAGPATLNVTLAGGRLLRGWVTGEGSMAFPNVTVRAVPSSGGAAVFTPGNKSDATGYYSVVIPAGIYNLTYLPDPASGVLDSVVLAGQSVTADKILNVAFPVNLATGIRDGMPSPAAILHQNHPNPFNPGTMIGFELRRAGRVRLDVHDARGARVRTLVEAFRPAGSHTVVWDGTDERGSRVASGVYFYRLTAHGAHETKKAVLLK